MTEPERTAPPSLAETAVEAPEESVRREREAVGEQPDRGGLVPPDDAEGVQPPA